MDKNNPHAIAGAGASSVLQDAETHSADFAKSPACDRRHMAHIEIFDTLSNLAGQIGALVRAMDHAPTDRDNAYLFDLLLDASNEAEAAIRDFLREAKNV